MSTYIDIYISKTSEIYIRVYKYTDRDSNRNYLKIHFHLYYSYLNINYPNKYEERVCACEFNDADSIMHYLEIRSH